MSDLNKRIIERVKGFQEERRKLAGGYWVAYQGEGKHKGFLLSDGTLSTSREYPFDEKEILRFIEEKEVYAYLVASVALHFDDEKLLYKFNTLRVAQSVERYTSMKSVEARLLDDPAYRQRMRGIVLRGLQ